MENKIVIKGAKENNLKNIDLELPKNSLIVFGELGAMKKGVSIIEKHPRQTTLRNRIVSKLLGQ